jgi:hypothetical protein
MGWVAETRVGGAAGAVPDAKRETFMNLKLGSAALRRLVLGAGLLFASTPAMAWEPKPGSVNTHFGVARVLDIAIQHDTIYAAFTGDVGAYFAGLRIEVPVGDLGPEWLVIGGARDGGAQSLLSMLMWARAQNLPVRVEFVAGAGSAYSLSVLKTCTDAAACEPGPLPGAP